VDEAAKMFRNHGLVYVISDTKYVKDKAAGIILELKPGVGEKVKEGRTVYLTVNTLDVPLRAIPDVADNSSLRQAQAKLLNAGFKLNQVQLVNGEKDWVYGVKYQGRQLAAGEKIPVGSSLTLMVGNGSGDTSEEDSADVSVDTDQPTQDDSWF
ncbi:MAG: PASTA domain-containing protein, partial [Bacteroides sp.]|nr:PASTA domain-containing protein [Bacteroides sp.]